MRWISLIQPRPDAPFPAWMIFPVIFAALYLSHFTLLRLPYYWDEAGYYIPAAWDFFRTGSLIPLTTLTNAHPPLPSIYLALWWKLFGFFPRSRAWPCSSSPPSASRRSGVWPCAWSACPPSPSGPSCSPPFIPSGLPRARWPTPTSSPPPARSGDWSTLCPPSRDRPANPGPPLSGFRSPRSPRKRPSPSRSLWPPSACFESRRAPGMARIRLWREAAWLASCVLPLAAWYAFHYLKTGFLFGNPEFLRYNAQANLSPCASWPPSSTASCISPRT